MLVFGSLALVLTLIWSIYKSIKNKTFKSVLNYLIHVAILTSFAYFIFVISCGINYNRYTFDNYYDAPDRDFTVEELATMCEDLILTGAQIRDEIDVENLGEYEASYSEILDLSTATWEEFEMLSQEFDVLVSGYSQPKSVFLSYYMSFTKITGVFFPWTVEANVNTDVPYYTLAYTMLHEQAHQRGFMREDEANFIAWLAGKDSDNLIIKYSAYMQASVYAMNSLYEVDYDTFAELYALYSDLQMVDKQSNAEYWEQFEGDVADTWTNVNDTYLKANGESDGIISYGTVTELLLRDYYK